MAQELTVDFLVDYETETAVVTFSNNQVEFVLKGKDDIENVAKACISGINWKGDMIEVKDGMVIIRAADLIYKIETKYCSNAFMTAYDLLRTVDFSLGTMPETKMEQKLSIDFSVDYETQSGKVTFSNDQIEFFFNGIDELEYKNASKACFHGFNYKGELIEVKNGMVIIRTGEEIYKIEAKYCGNAFITAYDLLCDNDLLPKVCCVVRNKNHRHCEKRDCLFSH